MNNKRMRTEVRNKGKRRVYQRGRGRPQIGMRLERRNISMKNRRMRTEVRNKGKRRVYQRGRGRPQIWMRLERRSISMKNRRMRTEVRNKIVMGKRQTSDWDEAGEEEHLNEEQEDVDRGKK